MDMRAVLRSFWPDIYPPEPPAAPDGAAVEWACTVHARLTYQLQGIGVRDPGEREARIRASMGEEQYALWRTKSNTGS